MRGNLFQVSAFPREVLEGEWRSWHSLAPALGDDWTSQPTESSQVPREKSDCSYFSHFSYIRKVKVREISLPVICLVYHTSLHPVLVVMGTVWIISLIWLSLVPSHLPCSCAVVTCHSFGWLLPLISAEGVLCSRPRHSTLPPIILCPFSLKSFQLCALVCLISLLMYH